MADTIKTNLGPVTAYADAKAHGYTGTREEFGQLLANAGLNLKAAETAKADAEAAKQAAETAQQAAASSASSASTSASTATTQAAAAKSSADAAASSATAAKASEAAAEKSAQGAAASESAAKAAQTAAETAKANADTAASNAAANATAAANSAADAKNTLESIPADYSALSGKVDENTSGISELKEDLANSKKAIEELNDKKITKFYASNLGETILNDSDNGKIQDMMLYGKSEQFSGEIELEDGTTVTVPCPDYPQEIKSVVNPKLEVCGKNLFNIDDGNISNSLLDFMGGIAHINYYWLSTDFIKVKPNTTYALSIDDATDNYIVRFVQYDAHKKFISILNDIIGVAGNTTQIITTKLATQYIRLSFGRNNKDTTVKQWKEDGHWIQIEENNQVTSYEPYQCNQATLPYTLNAIPVSSGGNVTIDGQQYIADYVDIENKKLWKYVYCGLLGDLTYNASLTEDSNWYDSSLSNSFELKNVSYNGHKFNESIDAGLCSKLKTYDFNSFYHKGIENGIMNALIYCIVNLSISLGIDTVEKFNEWAKGVYITKRFATPYSIDLTDEEVEAFKDLMTYYSTTNVIVTSDQLDGYTEFNYPVSLAEGWNYVKQQLGDTRDYIYDMDLQSAEAYVNSEYAVAIAELEV